MATDTIVTMAIPSADEADRVSTETGDMFRAHGLSPTEIEALKELMTQPDFDESAKEALRVYSYNAFSSV